MTTALGVYSVLKGRLMANSIGRLKIWPQTKCC